MAGVEAERWGGVGSSEMLGVANGTCAGTEPEPS